MTAWLSVRGLGMAHAAWQGQNLESMHSLHASSDSEGAMPAPDLESLPEYLRAYYGEDSPPALRRVPRYARMGLLAALRAMQEAGWKRGEEAASMACIIGSAWGSVEMSMEYMDSLLDQGPRLSSPTAFSHAVNNMGAGLLSLVLQSRGACQTLSQFSLSFAGAVQAATLELVSGRASKVLVGALDEMDPRFERSCPEAGSLKSMPHEGAVFFCLEAAQGDMRSPSLRVQWHGQRGAEQRAPETTLLLSGAAEHALGHSLRHYYGQGPLAQALDVAFALRQKDKQNYICRCREAAYGQEADVEVRLS